MMCDGTNTTLRARVICGFAGAGKSTAARSYVGVVDLESTPFQRDWVTYARVAGHMAANGYTVLMSCHKEIRRELRKQGIDYIVVMPGADADSRHEYMRRYRDRGNTDEFIEYMAANWDEFLKPLDDSECVIRVNGGITDIFGKHNGVTDDEILRMSRIQIAGQRRAWERFLDEDTTP